MPENPKCTISFPHCIRKLSYRTEQSYLLWAQRFCRFIGRNDPSTAGPNEVRNFLDDLAMSGKVSAGIETTQVYLHVMRKRVRA